MYSLSIFSNIMWAPIVYYQCPLKEQSENRRELAHVQKAHATASNVVCYFRNAPTSFSWLFLSPRWKDNRDKSRETCWLQHDQHCTHISPNLRFVYFYFLKALCVAVRGTQEKRSRRNIMHMGVTLSISFSVLKNYGATNPYGGAPVHNNLVWCNLDCVTRLHIGAVWRWTRSNVFH